MPIFASRTVRSPGFILLLLLLLPSAAWTGPQVGTITSIEGNVKIFSHPSKDSLEGPGPHAKYEGLFYSVKDAQIGDKIEKANLLRTQPGSRARVIFDNGDQINVAPATYYKIDWDKDSEDANTTLDLRYGKARFMITKGGPRKKFQVRTKAAVMGVRGTDFFVAINEETGVTETATLRGSVQVSPQVEGAKKGLIEAGQTGSVTPSAAEKAAPPQIEVRPTSQRELQSVQRNSVIRPAETPPVETVKELEVKAEKAALQDIRNVDPALAQKLEAAPPTAAPALDVLNQATVAILVAKAPSTGTVVGPIADETLENPTGQSSSPIAEVAESELPLPKHWLGIKIGQYGASLHGNNGNENGGGGGGSGGGEIKTTTVALTGEWVLGKNGALGAELFPHVRHGQHSMNSCSTGPCSGNSYFDVNIDSIDVVIGIKPGTFFGQSRRFGAHGFLGMRALFITHAEIGGSGIQNQTISDQIKGIAPALDFGFGFSARMSQTIRASLDIRGSQGFGEFSQNSISIGNNTTTIGSNSDFSILLGLSYGLFN